MKKNRDSIGGTWVRRIVRFLVRQYYSHIEITGAEQIPQFGPVLICANHANSLFDPVLVGVAARRPVRFMAKAPLFDTPVLGPAMKALGMVPAFRGSDDARQVRRNVESLDTVAQILVEGAAAGIFPEGKSHDAARLDTLRSGAGRIAVKAAEAGAAGVQVVPVGINYERKEQFQSRVWIRVGEPICVEEWLNKHDADSRKAMRALTSELETRMKSLVLHLDEEQWEPFLQDLQLLVPARRGTAGGKVGPLRQRKRIADAMNHFLATDRERAESVAADIRTYRDDVYAAGLRVGSPILQLCGWRLIVELLWQRLWVILLFIPALVGTLVHLVPFTIVRWWAASIQGPGRTTISQSVLLAGLPVYLLWYAAVGWWMYGYFTTWFATVGMVALPFLGLLALRYWPSPWVTAVLRGEGVRFLFQGDRLRRLREHHAKLREQLSQLADEYATIAPPTPPVPELPRRATYRKWAWRLAVLGVTAVIVWFAVHWVADRPLIDPDSGLDLRAIPVQRLDAALSSDEESLRAVIRGLGELEASANEVQAAFAAGRRSYDDEADNDAVRQLLLSYLNYRTALIRLIWKYQRYAELDDERRSDHAFLVGFTAASVLYDASLKFVHQFHRSEETVARLNEGEPIWNIPSGLYDSIERNLVNRANIRLLQSARQYNDAIRDRLESHGDRTNSEYELFHEVIARCEATARHLGASQWQHRTAVAAKDLTKLLARIRYDTQSAISTWIGDVKIREPRDGRSLIQPEHVARLGELLQPGDILLERRNWYVSNAFLPGYWPHAALYVGTTKDLQRLGLDDDPRVKPFWEAFSAFDADGHQHVIIEAISEGVIFASLEHSIGGADSAAVLRPNLSQHEIKQVIARAFSHVRKPYDFEFDFASRDRLVCTEVVFRSYGANAGPIGFPQRSILGRQTMPAIELVRKFKEEYESPDAQLKFVAIIDGDEQTGTAHFREDADAFAATLDRPALTFLQGFEEQPIKRIGPLGWSLFAVVLLFTGGNLLHSFWNTSSQRGDVKLQPNLKE